MPEKVRVASYITRFGFEIMEILGYRVHSVIAHPNQAMLIAYDSPCTEDKSSEA